MSKLTLSLIKVAYKIRCIKSRFTNTNSLFTDQIVKLISRKGRKSSQSQEQGCGTRAYYRSTCRDICMNDAMHLISFDILN